MSRLGKQLEGILRGKTLLSSTLFTVRKSWRNETGRLQQLLEQDTWGRMKVLPIPHTLAKRVVFNKIGVYCIPIEMVETQMLSKFRKTKLSTFLMFSPKEKLLLWTFSGRLLKEIIIIIVAPTSVTKDQDLTTFSLQIHLSVESELAWNG